MKLLAFCLLGSLLIGGVYLLAFRDPEESRAISAQGESVDMDSLGAKQASGSRDDLGVRIPRSVIQGLLVNPQGSPLEGIQWGTYEDGKFLLKGLTKENGSWQWGESDPAGNDKSQAVHIGFSISDGVLMVVPVAASRKPPMIIAPELLEGLVIWDGRSSGASWRVEFSPVESRMDLPGRRALVLSKRTREDVKKRECRILAPAGVRYRVFATAEFQDLRADEPVLRIPGSMMLHKQGGFPRIAVELQEESGRRGQVSGRCFLRGDGQVFESPLRDGKANLSAWRRLAWNQVYRLFLSTNDGESFIKRFQTPKTPTPEVLILKLRRENGIPRVLVRGLPEGNPVQMFIELADGGWLGVSSLADSDGTDPSGRLTRNFLILGGGEGALIGFPEGWRRLQFYYRDGRLAVVWNRQQSRIRAQEPSYTQFAPVKIADLAEKFGAKKRRGLLTFEMLLPGMVKQREYWVPVDRIVLSQRSAQQGPYPVWKKRGPRGVSVRLRWHVFNQPVDRDAFLYLSRK